MTDAFTPGVGVREVIMSLLLWCGSSAHCESYAGTVDAAIQHAAREWRVPAEYLLAIAWHESRVRPYALSKTDFGAWQLNRRAEWGKRAWWYCTRREATFGDCVREQAWLAAYVLRQERTRCRGWRGALAAYNTGRCDSRVGQRYASRVLRRVRVVKRRMGK